MKGPSNSKPVFIGIFSILAFSLAVFTLLLFYYGYVGSLDILARLLHKEQQLPAVRNFFTEQRFVKFQWFLVITCSGFIFLTFFVSRRYESFSGFLPGLWKEAGEAIKNRNLIFGRPFEKTAFIALLACFFAWNLFNCIRYPISYDEVWTYINFSRHPFLAAFYYPAANNHILFNLLTNLSATVTIDYRVEIRLVALLFGMASVATFFRLIRGFFSFPASLAANALFAFSYPVTLYSTMARGYILELFLFLVSTSCLLPILEGRGKKIHRVVFVLASCLAFYTLPSYLYAYATQLVFAGLVLIGNKQFAVLKELVFYAVGTSALVLFLYSPILIFNGAASITSNINTKPLPLEEIRNAIPAHISATCNWLFGTDLIGPILAGISLLLLSFFSFTQNRFRRLAQLCLLCFLLPVAFIYLHRVIPFPRTWIHLSLATGVAFALFAEIAFSKVRKHVLVISVMSAAGILIILALQFRLDHQAYHNNYHIDRKAGDFVRDRSFGNINYMYNHTWNFTSDCFETFIVYKRLMEGKSTVKIDRRHFDPSRQYELLILTDKDTIENNYLAAYNLLYHDNQVKIFGIKP